MTSSWLMLRTTTSGCAKRGRLLHSPGGQRVGVIDTNAMSAALPLRQAQQHGYRAWEALARRAGGVWSKRPTGEAGHRSNRRRRRFGALLVPAERAGTPIRCAAALLAKGR